MKKSLAISFLLLISFLSAVNAKQKETFEIGEKTFLLNGKPFVVKAAEVHYERIPRAYWDHRIKMCKALGMNTICLYVFWNFHEMEEGTFDFTGRKDIEAFYKLAEKNGLYVILRPGPYVCAEWEMGGLPWWLLKNKEIQLRKKDPFFLKKVRTYMNEIGKRLSKYQLSNGGKILMVQVENEYGAYSTDKPYMSAIRDIIKDAGFNNSLLFECDWSSTFEKNALPDLLWTMNFGAGANVLQQFKRLQQLRPNTPLMCSEYWSGWFDHWGARHETRSSKTLVDGLRTMLDNHISFSLYMTHGGTSFGHWAGANCPPFAPTCTSYDYDAPISEAGEATPKYYEVRKLLSQYLDEGQELPDVPQPINKIEIPSIEMNKVAPVFENLPTPHTSKHIKSMENFDQGWGSILYSTTLDKCDHPRTLLIDEVHDYAIVYINGKRIGALNRINNEKKIHLPAISKDNARLDIFVEAMGRMNFGTGIYDKKGITKNVLLKDEGKERELLNWSIYSYPVDYCFKNKLTYKTLTEKVNQPAFYKGTFKLKKTGDCYLDMSLWGKGLVWVNGKALGRFWKIGPQQTLFLPGCWLKKGKNEIVIFDVEQPQTTKVKGLTHPILDQLNIKRPSKHRKKGETLNLSNETPIISGSFNEKNAWQTVHFKNQKARFFCLEALNSIKGDKYTSIAEFYVLDANGKRLSRDNWKIRYADSEEVIAANNNANMIFDLQESTIWHTQYKNGGTKHPHTIVIDLGKEYNVGGFSYLPRQEEGNPGMIKDYNIYLSLKDFNYKK